jgi:glycolate oxidase subunit GlcD
MIARRSQQRRYPPAVATARARPAQDAMLGDLRALLGRDRVEPPSAAYLADAGEWRGLRGHADAVVFPESTEDVSSVLAWCSRHAVAVTPRGGGTGLAGGAVPLDGGVVVALERMTAVRSFDPALWRIQLEAGVRTAQLHRLARENGLMFAPDPGAAEQSQIGGNIATNAGGPHAFKYGATRAWVSGLEAVLADGSLIELGGAIRKDVAGYDLIGLLCGSEGTLAVITAAWLKLAPAPEVVLPVVAIYPDTASGCAAISAVIGSGLRVAALDYLDAGSIAATAAGYPGELPAGAGFMVILEADGGRDEAELLRDEAREALAENAIACHAPASRRAIDALWSWRHGAGLQIGAERGGKVSEDIVVPVEHLAAAVEATVAIGERHRLTALSWGHAGDGNLHSTFVIDPSNAEELERAEDAAEELFELAVGFGGSVSGEHGLGWVKRGQLQRQWSEPALALHEGVKRVFDAGNLLNPGKKGARRVG